jgi:putative ABC transport system permease protein
VADSRADIWIASPGIPHVNASTPILEKWRYRALEVPGVERAEKYSLQFAQWKLPGGASESVQVLGYDLASGIGGPVNVSAGDPNLLYNTDTVLIDELYKEKLGVTALGQTFEINGRRARIVGFTRGVRSFTTSPYIYMSHKNALNYLRLPVDATSFLLVRTSRGADRAQVVAALKKRLPSLSVLTREEMQQKTQYYWLFSTGAGITTLMGAALGLLVGMVVVAQTTYASTMDHIREFGTLKAMGAPNSYVYKVIIQQAVFAALAGYAAAIVTGKFVAQASASGGAVILVPKEVMVAVLFLSVGMCVIASLISIRKATTVDPAMVFKG